MKTWWRPSFSPLLPDQGSGCASPAASLVDAHVHVFPPDLIRRREACLDSDPRFAELYGSAQARMATAEEVLAQMEQSGTELSVIFGFAFSDLGLCREVNDYVLEAVRSYPGRLAGLACVPTGAAAALGELERCLDAGLRGCGELAPASGNAGELARLAPIAGCLRERGLPLVVHASEPVGHEYPGKGRFTPDSGVALARAHPGLNLVLSHLGGGLFLYELMPELRETLASVYYDTAAVPYLYAPKVYEVAILTVGPEKLIFGSDYPLLEPSRCTEGLERLLPQHQDAVRAGNARRVFCL
jgi:predicted TIM-barrel fold metal-dependent hydrolase